MSAQQACTAENSAAAVQVLAKLQTSIDSGAYYEAQQMYKTVFHRQRALNKKESSYEIVKVRVAATIATSNSLPKQAY